MSLFLMIKSLIRNMNEKPQGHLLTAGMALVLVGAHYIRHVAQTVCGVRQVRHPYHLLGHSVFTALSHHSLRLTVWYHLHMVQLTGRFSLDRGDRAQSVGLTWEGIHPLLDDRRHPGIRHLDGGPRWS